MIEATIDFIIDVNSKFNLCPQNVLNIGCIEKPDFSNKPK